MLLSLSVFCIVILRYGLAKLLFTMGLFGVVKRFKTYCFYIPERHIALVISFNFLKITCFLFALEHITALDA